MTSRVYIGRSCARARLLRCLTPLQVAAMALLRYFQVTASLPTAEDTTLGDTVTQSANADRINFSRTYNCTFTVCKGTVGTNLIPLTNKRINHLWEGGAGDVPSRPTNNINIAMIHHHLSLADDHLWHTMHNHALKDVEIHILVVRLS